jgi:hypothetical protein
MRLPSLLVLLALAAPGIALAGLPRGVTACDMRRIAAMYGMPVGKAKKDLAQRSRGSKILDTERGPMSEVAYQDVIDARKMPAECRFSETTYSYDDAVKLAQIWGVDPAGAKAIVEQKIANGYEDGVVWALEDSGKAMDGGKAYEDPDQAQLDAFWSSRYCYCDARLVAAAWQMDPYSAKAAIGAKIVNNDRAALGALEQTLAKARQQALARNETCGFYETNLTPADAEQLAHVWGSPLEVAKARIGDMVLRGQTEALLQQLGRGR